MDDTALAADEKPDGAVASLGGTTWYRDRALLALMLAAGLLGLIYNSVILVGYGPDEGRHMAYVKLLLDEHRLPFLLPDGSEYAGAHSYHPPLYYLVLVPLYAIARILPGEAGWHLVRAVSMLICVAAMPLLYQIALRAGNDDPGGSGSSRVRQMALLVVAQLGLLPIFGMTAGTINNDSAALLAITLFFWLLVVRYPHDRSWKGAALLGACLGLGALCKATALLCDGVAFLMYLAAQDGRSAWRSARNWGRLGLFLLVGGIIAGPWHLYCWNLYHSWTHLPPPMPPPLPAAGNGLLMVLLHPNFLPLLALANAGAFLAHSPTIALGGYVVTVPAGLFATLWSQKDWIPEGVRSLVYWVLAAYCLAAVAGALARRPRASAAVEAAPVAPEVAELTEDVVARRIAIWCPCGAFLASWLTVLQVALFMHWGWAEGGRYLLPAFSGFSVLLARGWRSWLNEPRLKNLTLGWSVLMLSLNALSVYWLLSYLNPTFGPK